VKSVLVTGAAGNVGREVVLALLQRGARVVAADHRSDRVRTLFGESVVASRLDFLDRGTWAAALQGAEQLFLLRPPAISDVENNLNPFVDFARSQGIDHVVFLSVAGVEKNRFVPHRKVEDHLRARGDHHTFLRPGFFAQNLETSYREDLAQEDRIYVPAGQSLVNWIDVRDIAVVAALVFDEPEEHRAQGYTLTGPGPIPWSDVIAALSHSLGRPIRYEPASILGYVRHLSARGLPRGAVLVQTILHVLLRFGQGATFDPTMERLLGRPGRSMSAYIAEHASLWAKPCGSEPGNGRR
jgi:uncharacterized protein YbjT (DUF2867 family)